MKTKKRRKDAPVFGRTKDPIRDSAATRRGRKADRIRRRKLVADVLARTSAGRAAIAKLAAGADMRAYAHLPSIEFVGVVHAPPKKNTRAKAAIGGSAPVTAEFMERMAVEPEPGRRGARPEVVKPPRREVTVKPARERKRIYTCSACGENGHRTGGTACRLTGTILDMPRLAA